MMLHPGFLLIGVFTLIVIGAIALVAFLVMRGQAVPVTFPSAPETPLQILDRRFAAGEIDAEEYKRARDLLTGGGPTA